VQAERDSIVASIAAGMIVNHVHPEYRKGETGRMVTLGLAGIVWCKDGYRGLRRFSYSCVGGSVSSA
jgi:hypothetical protein